MRSNRTSILRVFCMLCPLFTFASTSVATYGYQPAQTEKSCTPDNNLICNFNAILEQSYAGAFELPNSIVSPHPEIDGTNYYGATYLMTNIVGTAGSIAFGADEETIYIGGTSGALNGSGGFATLGGMTDSIAAFQIPPLVKNSDVNDRSNIRQASQIQPWTSVFKPSNNLVRENEVSDAHTVNGMHYDHDLDLLCLTLQRDYDNAPYSRANMLCYESPSNLKDSTIKGYFSVGKTDVQDREIMHTSGWMTKIPKNWQSKLGGKTLWGGGGTAAILDRLPVGPTLFAGSLESLPQNGHVNVNQLMTFYDDPGKQMGAHFFPSRVNQPGSWYQYELYNCDRERSNYNCAASTTESSMVVPWINNWWTIQSYGVQGFIVPGTDTYVVIGTMEGGEQGLSYKGNPEWKGQCGGPCRVGEFDYHNKYWLFDLKDILAAEAPWQVFPYEHGYLTFLDQFTTTSGTRSKLINAGFDLKTGRLGVVMRERAGNNSPKADVLIFQSADWVDQVITKARPPSILNATIIK